MSEQFIDECSYLMYQNYIKELMIKLNYDAVINLFGNAYAGEVANKMIQENNPFKIKIDDDKKKNKRGNTLENLKHMGIQIVKDKKGQGTSIADMIKKAEKNKQQK